jgi:hypothetical protein
VSPGALREGSLACAATDRRSIKKAKFVVFSRRPYPGVGEGETDLPLPIVVGVHAVDQLGVGGVVFGWLYWRKGLIAAMVAHFTADLVIEVLAPPG